MKLWEQNIRKVKPYVPGLQPKEDNIIKLNTNENPYPPAPGVERVMEQMKLDKLRLYPDYDSTELVNELAKEKRVDPEQIFIGVGSDDVLGMAFLTYFNSDKPVLFPDITYSFYDVWCELYKIPYERPMLDENFRIVKQDYYKENGGVVIANPNAPTSICESTEFIRDILEHNQDVVVIVDEAYVDFGGASSIDLLKEYDNLLVVQTFSKSRSLAGLRIGYAIGNKELIEALNIVKFSYNSYTMNTASIVLGAEAVRDKEYFQNTVNQIIEQREKTIQELDELGFTCLDSKANFVFATHKSVPAGKIYEELQKKKIYVRYFNKPRINNFLRITIGTEEEMNQLIIALGEIL
ncbi:histidinol-phosphate transaminase [Anaeromicropila populeti]|uniref:Histidinol-phosphate aminotransferase n=1 Tax=Anaeromicropila populeti TaxID=37658 RepID=A0A1I6HK56_9FIRM|nr:histidinol-phosphate transaminase [Anaeromicropila populeti]SFR54863.1 histidinol-phosphate aminotransferase [Anaeromicropila populeti]